MNFSFNLDFVDQINLKSLLVFTLLKEIKMANERTFSIVANGFT